jgi:formate dehydrogenase subunit delta
MVHRVNEIARFWEAYPHEEGLAGTAEHIRKFWEPRFRRQLLEHGESGGMGLRPLALEAVQLLALEAKTSR